MKSEQSEETLGAHSPSGALAQNNKPDDQGDSQSQQSRPQSMTGVKPPEILEEDEGEGEDDKNDLPMERQDLFVCFTNDKDLRHPETISIKSQNYKGIAVRVKILNHIWIENLLFAIESAPDQGIVNLRFEECKIMKRAVQRLIQFCHTTSVLKSIGLIKIDFDDGSDFKKLVEAISFNQGIEQFSVQGAEFDEDYHGKTMSKCILESRSLKELDLSYVIFDDPKSFYEMANGLLNERCRLGALKLRGIAFGQLEGKVMQFILMRNKSLMTLDLSQCSTDSPENMENVFCKFDQFCSIRTLVAENLNCDFNYIVEIFGEALGVNTKMEGLSLKENKLKQTQYCNFWELMAENRSLRKINVAKTEVTDKVCAKISNYLSQPDLRLSDLNLSRNQISTEGLIALAEALQINSSLKTLNLAQNFIKEGGIPEFVTALRLNNNLAELCLSFNKINNQGISSLSGFLADNTALKVLDISRNVFTDTGFIDFAKGLANNRGIESLNLSKNKDVSDEYGLRVLADSLATNSSLSVIDLSGLKVRKPCVLQYFQPALKQNITLKRIVGKIPPGIINADLKDNMTIEGSINKNFKTIKKEMKRELNKIPIHKTDEDQTQLVLRDMENDLLLPALKLIRYRKIHVVDLSNMQLEDESLRQLSVYLEENPAMRSLGIASNYFTDDGLMQLIQALRSNTHLNHLNITDCKGLTDQSLRALEDMVTEINMSLYNVELGDAFESGYDEELVQHIMNQTKMNRAIQENLKPVKVEKNGLVEILFEPKVKVANFFDSAIKIWRILGPTSIYITNENLEDQHVHMLTQFLSGRNLIKQLNLRRNKIGDKGAIDIANYVKKADRTLVSLELERNEINDEGGEALLKAMQANMRMESCKTGYGNPMRQKIARQIEREIKANLQIRNSVVPIYKENGHSLKYFEGSDRGPDFVRCALKSCELFKILHLSLPDNMIGEKEMIDIAYVISKNTPLTILNLSNNVVDPKAALVLANSLANNSNLKTLDLRNNKLGNCGVALIMELFIKQQLQKHNREFEKARLKEMAVQEPPTGNEDKKKLKLKKEKREAKIRTKLEKLQLDHNTQSNMALKHIYTVLISNKELEITIDLPENIKNDTEESEPSDLSSVEEMEDDEDDMPEGAMSPAGIVSVVPLNSDPVSPISNDQTENFSLKVAELTEEEKLIKQQEEDEKERKKRTIKYKILRLKCCKPVKDLCFRDPAKPKKSCPQIICPTFLQARSRILRFKTTWTIHTHTEKTTAFKLYLLLLLSIVLYYFCGVALPFLASFLGGGECSSVSPLYVYMVYGLFVLISSGIELIIIMQLRKVLIHPETNEKMLPFNRYLLGKCCQGQLANFVSFMHFCYVAAALLCFTSSQEEEENADPNAPPKEMTVLEIVTIVLALISAPILIMANIRRAKFTVQYVFKQPNVHKLLPEMQRITQLAWILNFQAAATTLESTSLSDYIFEYGGLVVTGKEKYRPANFKSTEVKVITSKMLRDKMWFADYPMLAIMTVQFVSTFGSGNLLEMIISLIQIATTAMSIMSGMISLRFADEEKGVDMRLISKKINERMAEALTRQQALLDEKAKSPQAAILQKAKTVVGKVLEESSDDTERSEALSGMGDVADELAMFTDYQSVKGVNYVNQSMSQNQKSFDKSIQDTTQDHILQKDATFDNAEKLQVPQQQQLKISISKQEGSEQGSPANLKDKVKEE